ncbi:MAG TPA: hypothetical protein VEZ59_00690 [Sphingopyxis sp.]|nr:hypothetical protein [Sphingopyxis sp.]
MASSLVAVLTAIAVVLPILVILYFANRGGGRSTRRERSDDSGAHVPLVVTDLDGSKAASHSAGWDSGDTGGGGDGGGGD